MTGDEAYHADCFRCIQCESKIDDLVFAKTSQGIYCMKCHQERKEAKRLREERERMERAERMMEKLLPTIPESEKRSLEPFPTTTHPPASIAHNHLNSSTVNEITNNPISKDFPQQQVQLQHNQQHQQQQYQQHQHYNQHHIQHNSKPIDTPVADQLSPDMPRLPFYGLQSDKTTPPKPNKIAPPYGDHRSKADPAIPSVDIGPPFLPPLIFGLDDASTSSFDLGDMLGGPESKTSDKQGFNSDPPTPPAKDVEVISSLGINSFRASVSKASLRLSLPPKALNNNVPVLETSRSSTDGHDMTSLLKETPSSDHLSDSILLHPQSNAEDHTMILQEAEAMIRELRIELAKYNPMSPLLHGTTQQEYGLLLDKTRKLSQEHAELEKTIRDMYIEKDMLGMDLEAMNNELKAKEEALASGDNKLQPTTVQNPRLSTNHEFMKQAYLMEVKALQEQKDRLQRDIQVYVDQRDSVLNEMQILSVRNAELSTINNDMMREMQGRMDIKPTITPLNNGMLQSFTDKIRRQRQMSGGNQSDLRGGALLGSGESTHSLTSTLSDDQTRNRLANDPTILKTRKEDMVDDNAEEGTSAPKKFNWKKGTTNTVKSVGAMFGKLLVEGPNSSLEVPHAKVGQSLSESGSVNSLLLPPTRTLSNSSETRSLNGRSIEQHAFIQHNFVRPIRCDACDDKLWGREYRCRNCAFHIHGRCMHDIIPGCVGASKDSDSSSFRDITPSGGSGFGVPPPPPAKQIMFGNDLLDQLGLEQRLVPLVVEKCIEAVDERGLEVEGIYRRSGMAAEARQLVQMYDIGLQPDLMDSDIYQDICSITSVLKQYLRSLPQPLIPYDLYAEFMEAISLPQNNVKMQTFKDLMDRMPVAHYATLKVLLEHLNRVTQRDKINLMNAKNLSVVFGPTLMRNPDPSREIMDMTFKNLTIEFFIVHTSELFAQDARPSTSGSGGSNTGRLSSSSNHERPSTSSSSISASNGPSASGRVGLNSTANQPSPPPRRVPTNSPQAGSPPLSISSQPSSLSSRSVAGDTVAILASASGQLLPQSQTSQPSQPLLPQPQPYQPVSQYRPQQHQTLQQLHQKQQQLQLQLQLQQKQQQQQQQQQEQQELQQSLPTAPFSTSNNYVPTPQQQQANPEVDLTHFP
ncbi:hypothetical protein BG015_009601 [Linnemannia schmuckeri]|uniref:RhoGAP-domain-containing protein n=1 Tax=Linnemannia schmuckeri TaxID=64567 RepID=A0A9P5VEL8_9FUNG|nr:hypothetical protein BG015_009601 [Linnemannia schmuckeri]